MNLIIEILKAIVLGVVEGITEWLPISSTGHMILVDEFLHLNVTPQFKEMFLVVIQLGCHFGRSGAVLAQAVAFWYRKQAHCAQERHLANVVQGAGQLRAGCRGGRAL